MHSGIHASFPGAIYGRANYSGDESHLQQANVIQDWGNDVQVKYHWVKNCLHYQQKILSKSKTTTLTIWMQLQNVS
jgi:hypothetical protein